MFCFCFCSVLHACLFRRCLILGGVLSLRVSRSVLRVVVSVLLVGHCMVGRCLLFVGCVLLCVVWLCCLVCVVCNCLFVVFIVVC